MSTKLEIDEQALWERTQWETNNGVCRCPGAPDYRVLKLCIQ
jgi:hypothetical protein